jgi:methionyl-tRNA formyltransferase
MGTPAMSAHVLSSLLAAGFNVVGLVCQEDKEVGREKTNEVVPTKAVALAHNIPVFQPHKIRLDFEFAKTLDFDVIVTMAYGQIIPQGLLGSRQGRLRQPPWLPPSEISGAAPIQRRSWRAKKKRASP